MSVFSGGQVCSAVESRTCSAGVLGACSLCDQGLSAQCSVGTQGSVWLKSEACSDNKKGCM